MSDVSGESGSGSLARSIVDLVVVVCLAAVATVVVLVSDGANPLRVVLGIGVALFAPGYVVVAALFPRHGRPAADPDATSMVADRERIAGAPPDGVDVTERVALSVAVSIVVSTLVGLVLAVTGTGIPTAPLALAVTAVTVLAAVVAAVRRRLVPAAERFSVAIGTWPSRVVGFVTRPVERPDRFLNLLLVVGVVVAAAGVSGAILFPANGESFTDLTVLADNGSGQPIASGYPTDLSVGTNASVLVGVGNHEGRSTNYTVLVELQRVSTAGNGSEVTREATLDRVPVTVAPNTTARRSVDVTPAFAGERLRVAVLLYRGAPPANPTVENAYRTSSFWVDVTG